MAFRAGLVFLVVAALAAIATAAAYPTEHGGVYYGLGSADGGQGLVASAMREVDEEFMMESDSARRQLGEGGYVSYGALSRNKVPCNQRGQSYYNCRSHQKANPYTRGCTRLTNCARATR